MKKLYKAPSAEILKFDSADVITTSGCDKVWDDIYSEWYYFD